MTDSFYGGVVGKSISCCFIVLQVLTTVRLAAFVESWEGVEFCQFYFFFVFGVNQGAENKET